MTDMVRGVTGRIKLASKVKTVRVMAVNEVFNMLISAQYLCFLV